MAKLILKLPVPYEPKTDSRWIINTHGFEIPSWLFRNYKLYNEGEKIIMECEILEQLNITFKPSDLMTITDVSIDYLDPVGVITDSLIMEVKGINFTTGGDYSSTELKKTHFRFEINSKTIKTLNK
jgi:hypothetical protein